MKAIITVKDEIWCYITGLMPTHVTTLWNEFGVYVDGYFFMPAYKMGNFDGKIRFFDKHGKTYIRLLDRILPSLDKWGYDIELVDNRKFFESPVFDAMITKVDESGLAVEATYKNLFEDVLIKGKPFFLRPYQVQCVMDAVHAGSGTIIGGTGMGKTSVTAAISHLYSRMGYKVITMVPSADLVDQTAEWYEKLEMDVGVYSGSKKELEHANVVATWQSIQYNPSILKDFQAIIWDECVHPDTLITTSLGNIPINEIVEGDLVLTLNELTNKKEFKPVKKVHKNLNISSREKRLKIKFENGKELIITGNHKILTKSGWKRADELTLLDEIV